MRLFASGPSHPLIKINESRSFYGELLQKNLCSSFAFERILHLENSLALLHLKCHLAILHLKYLGSIFQVRQRSPLVVSLFCRGTLLSRLYSPQTLFLSRFVCRDISFHAQHYTTHTVVARCYLYLRWYFCEQKYLISHLAHT